MKTLLLATLLMSTGCASTPTGIEILRFPDMQTMLWCRPDFDQSISQVTKDCGQPLVVRSMGGSACLLYPSKFMGVTFEDHPDSALNTVSTIGSKEAPYVALCFKGQGPGGTEGTLFRNPEGRVQLRAKSQTPQEPRLHMVFRIQNLDAE